MTIFCWIIEIFLMIISLILLIVIIKQIYANIIEKKLEKKRLGYINYILKNLINKKEMIFFSKDMGDELVNAIIEIINSISGEMRKRLIKVIYKEKIIDYAYNNYKKVNYKYNKEYYLYVLGELRCKKYLKKLLEEDLIKIQKQKLIISYFFSLVLIVDEWIFDLDEKVIYEYIDKLIDILELMEKLQKWKTKRLIDYLLNGTKNFFAFTVNNYKFIDYLITEVYKRNVSLDLKGSILYIISLNREYKIINFIETEYLENIGKKQTQEETEYLIKIIKSLAVLGLRSSNELLLQGIKSENWVIRSESVKGLANFSDNIDIIYEKLFDENWWVRYNSALSIFKFGIKGRSVLFSILKAEIKDKYAKDIAAYILVDNIYMDMVKESIENKSLFLISEEILLIVNEGNNMKILNKIIESPNLEEEYKIKFISKITSYKFYEHYENSLKNSKNISINIKNVIEEKRGDILD